jgi:hypothetical protein
MTRLTLYAEGEGLDAGARVTKVGECDKIQYRREKKKKEWGYEAAFLPHVYPLRASYTRPYQKRDGHDTRPTHFLLDATFVATCDL